MSEYGHFSENGREYIVTRPDTPRPWINYLSNEKICALCSHTGGGYAFYETSGYNRITREYPSLVVLQDRPGRFVYLRDRDTGEYWNINWQPVLKDVEDWESIHCMGWTSVRSTYKEIEGHITYFVPRRDDVEIWMVRIKNNGKKRRRLSAFSYVEWSLANYSFNITEAAFSQLFNVIDFHEDVIFATTRYWNVSVGGGGNPNLSWDKYAFLTSSLKPVAYDTLIEEFIGMYRSVQNPIALERGYCSNSAGNGRDICGALQHDLDFEPGEEKRLLIILGVANRKDDAFALKDRYKDWTEASHALREVNHFWDDYLSRTTCEAPDKNFCISFNYWNKYQAWITSRWSRMDSYYIGGSSIVGFRDSWQDMLGVLPNDVEWARQRVIYMLEHQFPDGSTLHNWDPLTNIGVKTGHSDDSLWLVMGTIEYIKESGELDFLDQHAAYYDGGSETVRQHILHALDYTLSRMSQRGIPLMEAADWNDGLDQVGRQGRGESAMVAEHLVWMLKETANLLDRTGRDDLAVSYRQSAIEVSDALNKHLWDGEWYCRGTRDDGQVFGSSKNDEGKIYLNAQSWAVLSGAAQDERGNFCMDSALKHLDTEYGLALFLPSYSEPNPKMGIISRFAPGTKENGTIFNHPVCWAVMALCKLGRGDDAYEVWRKSSFVERGENPDIYKTEPYVYSEYVHGPDSVTFGQGEFSWMTGTAAWMWKVCLEWILGVRPDYDGLTIDPCIPKIWDSFKVNREFRNAKYTFYVNNNEHVCKGIKRVMVDGREISGNIIPSFHDDKTHEVHIEMG